MDSSIVKRSALDVGNLKQAHNQYDDFVDVYGPVLTLSEFVIRRNLQLNEQCASVFYAKTAHLNDIDFVEVDRTMLNLIGFKNTFVQQKDKHGNAKVDRNGDIKLKDMRIDFSSALRCLRNTVGFTERTSFDDTDAHFVVKKTGVLDGTLVLNGGQNKQQLWIRMRALEHFIIMANTTNSYMIREFFLDLKRILTEYNKYQTVYRSQLRAHEQLIMKDSQIQELRNDIHLLMEKSDFQATQLKVQYQQLEGQSQQLEVQTQQLDVQSQQLDVLSKLLYKESDDKVLDIECTQKKQELVVLQNKDDPNNCVVLRGQKAHVNMQLKKNQSQMHVVGTVQSYKNPINLYNLFSEQTKQQKDDCFNVTNNKVTLKNGTTPTELVQALQNLEEKKHSVAEKVKSVL